MNQMTDPRNSFDDAGVQWAFDSTSLKAGDKCLRYYKYSILDGWQSPFASVHLWFGGLYASTLERYHKMRADGVEREEAIAMVVTLALVGSWNHDLDENGKRIPGTGSAATFDHSGKTRETLIRTIVWYFDFYGEDPLQTYLTKEGKAAVEFSFQIPADNGITLCGHIDRVCVDHDHNILIQDQKTTGSTLGPYYFSQFKPDIQFQLYTLAGKMVYQIPVKGVIVDAAQIVVGFSKFSRFPVMHTDGELNEFYDETMTLVEQIRSATQDDYFPRRPSSCHLFGGCEFRSVCSRPSNVRDNFLRGDFKKRTEKWDPINRR